MKYGRKLLFLPILILIEIQKFKTFSFLALFAIFFLLFAISFGFVRAQNQNYDVTLSPVFFDLSVNPGGSVSDRIRVRNNTNSPLRIKLEVKKLTGDEEGELTLKDTDPQKTLSWIKFESATITASPLEWTNVPFKIEVPKNAAYGYYFAVSFTQADPTKSRETGATITGAASVPILLNVRKEGAKFEGKLLSFKSDASYYEYLPTRLTTTFENTGNVHIRPVGNVFIKDWLGRQIATLNVNDTGGAVLPNTKRSFETSWNDSFIVREPKVEDGQAVLDKNGKPKTSLKIKFDKILDLRIGRYSAEALMVISTDTRDIPFQAQTSFFVFPWKVVGGVILFVIFAGVGFFSTIKRFVLRIIRIFRR